MPRQKRSSLTALAGPIAFLAFAASDARGAVSYDWPQFDGNARHSGNDTSETTLSTANVAQLKQLFQVTLPAVADGAPAVLTSVPTTGGTRDLLFVNTKQGNLLALDAHTGATLWSVQHGNTSCASPSGPCITESSPAVDPGRGFVYAYALDGSVHKHSVATGAETTGGGWPEMATAKPDVEKGSSALTVATARSGTSYLYVTHSGYIGDAGDYQGHLTAINLTTGAQSVFNSLCSNQTIHFVESGTPDCASAQSGIWARAGVTYDSDVDKIFAVTGNGAFAPSNDDWGDSVMELNADGTGAAGQPVDSYTPTDFQALQNGDSDLGSTDLLVLPTPAGFPFPHVGAQSGKDGVLRLLDLDNLSDQGSGPSPGRTGGELATVQLSAGVFAAPAAWVNPADGSTWVFVTAGSNISGYQLTASGSSAALALMWTVAQSGTSPVVANNVLYLARANTIQALAAVSGTQLWQAAIGGIHWESPVVANGVLYIMDESAHLTAFSVPAAAAIPALPSWALGLGAAFLLMLGLYLFRSARPSSRAV
ncbi:MAG TPA: PQQ-binding-like beta-propeller repeat protein [Polyangia bacterium]|nr:PQQ-binding-like beta-propeller repeat protein [Polyangia bacterium]